MANFAKMQEVASGFVTFSKNFSATSFPAQKYATPGIFAKSLYSRYVPLNDPGFDGNSPFRSEKTLQNTIQHQADELTYARLETTKTEVPEQIGHGDLDGAQPLLDKPPSPYNDEKMQQVLEKMRHPVYNVNVVKNEEPLKKLKSTKRKKTSDLKSNASKSDSEKPSKYFKWYK